MRYKQAALKGFGINADSSQKYGRQNVGKMTTIIDEGGVGWEVSNEHKSCLWHADTNMLYNKTNEQYYTFTETGYYRHDAAQGWVPAVLPSADAAAADASCEGRGPLSDEEKQATMMLHGLLERSGGVSNARPAATQNPP